jgi:flagellar hook protein FlgE
MDVVGNNVANVNTIGFKAGRVTFQEVFSQTLRGAGAPDTSTGRGGINPMQVGLGLGIGAVDTIVTRGSTQRTDNPTDLSIEGEGYFIVKTQGDTFKFSRAGNFGIDKLGNLVNGDGLNVYGWQEYEKNADGSYAYDTEKPIESINLYQDIPNKNKKMISAKATTNVVFSGNLDASEDIIASGATSAGNVQFSTPMTVYDSLGNDYKIYVNFWKVDSIGGASGVTTWNWNIDTGSGITSTSAGTITFDTAGQIIPGSAITPGIQLVPGTLTGTDAVDITLDFSNITMYSADSSAKPTNIDGYSTGNLVSFNIGADGIITGIYSNGQQQPLGLISVAVFENPGGLQKVGNNLFIPTTNSGDFKKGMKPGLEGAGALNPGTLEMSNVDLSKEFTEMIITQRGFQANSRIITTSDEMLQELVNLKR